MDDIEDMLKGGGEEVGRAAAAREPFVDSRVRGRDVRLRSAAVCGG